MNRENSPDVDKLDPDGQRTEWVGINQRVSSENNGLSHDLPRLRTFDITDGLHLEHLGASLDHDF